jgi:hypothetical protein
MFAVSTLMRGETANICLVMILTLLRELLGLYQQARSLLLAYEIAPFISAALERARIP